MRVTDLEHCQNVVVLRTDVAVTAERRHSDRVSVQYGQIIAVSAVDDSYPPVPGRKPPGENRNEGRR